MNTANNTFTITLDAINSVFGISGDTLHAIAASYGVDEEQIIIRALTQWAKTEIPDLDLESPTLTAEQFRTLLERRKKIDANKANPTSLLDMFNSALREQGESNHGNANSKLPLDGKHS